MVTENPLKRPIQASLFIQRQEVRYPNEVVKAGDPSVTAYTDVLRANHDITRVMYVVYDPSRDSSYESFIPNQTYWLASSLANAKNLRSLSESVWRSSEKQVQTDYDQALVFRNGIAMGSRVSMKGGGGIMNIPMIDFEDGAKHLTRDERVELMDELGVGPGYLIDSGVGMHFIGMNLLGNTEWASLLDRADDVNQIMYQKTQRQEVIDQGFVRMSRQRGFSALRLFSYPPDKPEEPKVIEIIT